METNTTHEAKTRQSSHLAEVEKGMVRGRGRR
jgi:hypothetical protein